MLELNGIPIDKIFQIFIPRILRASFVLTFVHCAVHAGLEERSGGFICARCDIFIKFVYITSEIAPYESGFAVKLSRTKFEFFANQENSLFVG